MYCITINRGPALNLDEPVLNININTQVIYTSFYCDQ